MELIRKIYSTLAGNRKDVEVTKGWLKRLQSGSFLGHLIGVGRGKDLICVLLNQWEGEKASLAFLGILLRFVHSRWIPPSRFFILFQPEKGPIVNWWQGLGGQGEESM